MWILTALVLVAVPAEAARFQELFTAISANNLAAVKGLTPSGGAINGIDVSSGATPLTWASMRNVDPGIAKWLISKGADVNRKDGEGETPLTTAADYGNIGVVKFLLANGADPHTTNRVGTPPIVLASGQNGQLEIVKVILARGVNIKGKIGTQAMEYAHAFKKQDIARFLKSKGAKPSYFKALKRLLNQ